VPTRLRFDRSAFRDRACYTAAVAERTILHVDLDAFFASVEVRENPALRGKPVVVGADPQGGRGRGVVAAASYEAREHGIHSALPISQAYRRCPDAVFLRPRGKLYAEVSERFMGILRRYTDLVEPLSIDEAFLDVTGSLNLFGGGETVARRIKDEVKSEEGLTASIGVSPVKFVAKIASDFDKPDGLVVVKDVAEFLARVPIQRLWGAGPKALERFRRLGVENIGDVAAIPLDDLRKVFGEAGARHFHRLACGEDERGVVPEHKRKSVGREMTFLEDVTDRSQVGAVLLNLVEEVSYRLRRKGLAGQTVTVKLRTADFHTVTRQAGLPEASDLSEQIWPVARELLRSADTTSQDIRLVGVAISGFEQPSQLSLFNAGTSERDRRIAGAVDAVVDRFGTGAIRRGLTSSRGKEDRR
jgi:DNA polymerase-4